MHPLSKMLGNFTNTCLKREEGTNTDNLKQHLNLKSCF